MSIRWREVCWFGFLMSSCFVSCEIALIGSSAPVPRLSFSRNCILFSPVLFLLLCLFAFLFWFWLGCAVDHRLHTHTTTPFHYLYPFMLPCAISPSSALPTYLFLNWHFQLRISTSVSLRPNFLVCSTFLRFAYSVSCCLYAREPYVQIYPGAAMTMLVGRYRWGSAASWATNA